MREKLESVLGDLVHKAEVIAESFMEHRTGRPTSSDRWSDLGLRVRHWKGSLTVEWYRRVWSRGENDRRRYRKQYLRESIVTRYAKEWEEAEVRSARERLGALKKTHQQIKQACKTLDGHGLFADDADIAAGFIPISSLASRHSLQRTRGRWANDECREDSLCLDHHS